MLTLAILRHAKSSWEAPGQADFDRPLSPRGSKAAPLMGRHMREIGLAPDLVLCSPALRTRQTAALALAAFGEPRPRIAYDRAIYEATADDLMARLAQLPSRVRHALLIGHNPGLQDLVLALAGRPLPQAQAWLEEKMPTAALVVMDLDAESWNTVAPGRGRITHAATPRMLDA